jgi:hypothetical protein
MQGCIVDLRVANEVGEIVETGSKIGRERYCTVGGATAMTE